MDTDKLTAEDLQALTERNVTLPLNITQLREYLPHRYPFLLLDRVTACRPNEWITAIKNVTVNEPFFNGHFPEEPIMPGVLIAQACGRWGNFFNHEAFGSAVSLNFLKLLQLPQFIINNMYIEGAYHHPTFLYESVGNLIVFLVFVLVVKKKAQCTGEQFFSYFIGYGIVRFFVEGLRTDSLMLGPIRMAQLTSIVFIIAGVAGIYYLRNYQKRKS